MSSTAVMLVLLSAVLHVSWNFFTKASSDPKSFTMISGGITIALTVVVIVFFPLWSITGIVWGFIIASGLLHTVYLYALSSAYETGDVSFVYPIARSAPAFVAVGAIWIFGEALSPWAMAGVALVSICIFLLQLRGDSLIAQWCNLKKFLHKPDSLWAFVTLGSVIAYTLNDKAGMVAFTHVGAIEALWRGPLYYLLVNTIAYLGFAIVVYARRETVHWNLWQPEWKGIVFTVFGSFLSYSLILYVLQTEDVSLVAALRQSSILFAVVVGWVFLKEPHAALRLAAALGMLIGLTLVAST